jgi:hypothetical protein
MNTKKTVMLLFVVLLFTVFSFAGVQWTTSIKTTGKGKKANNEIDAHTYAQGGNVKQVFTGVTNEDMFRTQTIGSGKFRLSENTKL